MRYVTGGQSNFYKNNAMNFNIRDYGKEVAKLKRINTTWEKACDKLVSARFSPKSKKKEIRINQLENNCYKIKGQLNYQKRLIRAMNRRLDDLGRVYPKRVSLSFVKLNLLELKMNIRRNKKRNLKQMSSSEFKRNKNKLLYKHTGSKERLEKQLASLQNRKARLTKMQNMSEDEKTNKHLDNATPEKLEEAQQFADKSIEIIENKLATL